MTGRTQEVDPALFWRRFHVPCWALAHVFGRDAMYGSRLEQGLGRFSVVGTTVKRPEHLLEGVQWSVPDPRTCMPEAARAWKRTQAVMAVIALFKRTARKGEVEPGTE